MTSVQYNIKLALLSSKETINNFALFYNIDNKSNINEIFETFLTNFYLTKKKKEINLTSKEINYSHLYFPLNRQPTKITDQLYYDLTKINIDDYIYVSYIPYSQKYLTYYEQEAGSGNVIFIDSNNNDLIYWYKNGDTYVFKSLIVESCGFLGTQGYDFFIEK
jgi:hypothetical protein